MRTRLKLCRPLWLHGSNMARRPVTWRRAEARCEAGAITCFGASDRNVQTAACLYSRGLSVSESAVRSPERFQDKRCRDAAVRLWLQYDTRTACTNGELFAQAVFFCNPGWRIAGRASFAESVCVSVEIAEAKRVLPRAVAAPPRRRTSLWPPRSIAPTEQIERSIHSSRTFFTARRLTGADAAGFLRRRNEMENVPPAGKGHDALCTPRFAHAGYGSAGRSPAHRYFTSWGK